MSRCTPLTKLSYTAIKKETYLGPCAFWPHLKERRNRCAPLTTQSYTAVKKETYLGPCAFWQHLAEAKITDLWAKNMQVGEVDLLNPRTLEK
eukprot:355336-Pelagomonas_calceolata.AAC.2